MDPWFRLKFGLKGLLDQATRHQFDTPALCANQPKRMLSERILHEKFSKDKSLTYNPKSKCITKKVLVIG